MNDQITYVKLIFFGRVRILVICNEFFLWRWWFCKVILEIKYDITKKGPLWDHFFVTN